ncbi:MAG: UxaA family hydrolase, partial [Deinococcota bacterium]|nr:UxaA family hydrolase [Deinococcota bacterium]
MANIHYFNFNDVARLPLPGDNAAIATRRLDGGTTILYQGKTLTLEHTVMEGHRFAIKAVVSGEALLSWGLPFGVATRDLAAGTYICNHGMLEALRVRELDFAPPAEPNFMDNIEPYLLEEDRFELAQQVLRHEEPRTFMGYRRRGPRGVGTRNAIVLLGTTSRTSSYVRQLEERLKGVAAAYGNIDGIAAVA